MQVWFSGYPWATPNASVCIAANACHFSSGPFPVYGRAMCHRLHTHLTGLLILLVVALISLAPMAGFAAQGGWSKAGYLVETQQQSTQSVHLAFTVRAPPVNSANVAITGTHTQGKGNMHVLPSVASVGDISVFLLSLIATNTGASNIATAQRLADHLRLASARSPFRPDRKMTPIAIAQGDEIIPAYSLGNPNIPVGFGKYDSPTFQSPSGDFKLHYYYNPTTNQVIYDLDYMVILTTKETGHDCDVHQTDKPEHR